MFEKKKVEKDEVQQQWDQVLQFSSASTEQLELYRTQTLVKLDGTLYALSKDLRTLKRLMIAILIILILIALFI